MQTSMSFAIARTAVVAMDCQTGLVPIFVKQQEEFIERASGVLRAAREAGMPIILVQVGFRPGLPEVGSRNKLFNAIKSWPQKKVLYEGTIDPIHPALGPEGADIVVTKRRVSSFAGTELELLLRAKEIDTLVLFGLSTGGAVLSTVLDASDADYKLFVISDCCDDTDGELHEVLVNRLFPLRAEVLTASQFIEALKASNSSS